MVFFKEKVDYIWNEFAAVSKTGERQFCLGCMAARPLGCYRHPGANICRRRSYNLLLAGRLPGHLAAIDIPAPTFGDRHQRTVKFVAGCMAAGQLGCYRHPGAATLRPPFSKSSSTYVKFREALI